MVDKASSTVVVRGNPPRNFTFDGVLGEDASQEEVFELVGTSVGASCLSGYNGSLYVYGQTGAGKTYTMSGPVSSVQSMQSDPRRGVISRMLGYIFNEMQMRQEEEEGVCFSCRCSFLEIYKETITDLLEPGSTNLQIREDLNRGVYVERLSEAAVGSLSEAFQVVLRGLQQRHVGSTHMNERSSRSHAVFTLWIEAARTRAGVTSTRTASLNLIDLAGSERQQAPSEAAGFTSPQQSLRVKEAGAINKSLSALTNVIMSLSREERSRRKSAAGLDGRRSGHFVHYRDSRLTFLLRDSLGGNSKTVIVANISPSPLCAAETLSTLKFAARAKHIRCAAVCNEEFSGTVESLMREVKLLRQRLSDLSGPRLVHRLSPATLEFAEGPSPVGSVSGVMVKGDPLKLPEGDKSSWTRLEQEGASAGWEDILYGQWRVRLLEVLLADALTRERQAEEHRRRLQHCATFLEELDFRKCTSFRRLHADYVESVASEVANAAVTKENKVHQLTAKVAGFSQLLAHTFAPSGPLERDGPGTGLKALPMLELPAEDQAEVLGRAGLDGHEVVFLREENPELWRQVMDHPEVSRLRAENLALRRRLAELDPGGRAWNRTSWIGEAEDEEGLAESPGDDSSDGEPLTGGGDFREEPNSVPPLTSELLLRSVGTDEVSLQGWFHLRKMAKEAEELQNAQESLKTLLDRLQDLGRQEAEASKEAKRPPVPAALAVEQPVLEDFDTAVKECLQTAQALLTELGFATDQLQDCGSPGRAASMEEQFKQAKGGLQQLQELLDLVNTSSSSTYAEFQRVREQWGNCCEECHFLEHQCNRLNQRCDELSRSVFGVPVRSGQIGLTSFSAAGLPVTRSALALPSRSYSVSALRTPGFWEQRFEELSQLTGLRDGEYAPSCSSSSRPPGPSPVSVWPTLQPSALIAGIARPASTSALHPSATAWASSPVANPCYWVQAPSPVSSLGSPAMVQSGSLTTLRNDNGVWIRQQLPAGAAMVRRVASAPLLPGYAQAAARVSHVPEGWQCGAIPVNAQVHQEPRPALSSVSLTVVAASPELMKAPVQFVQVENYKAAIHPIPAAQQMRVQTAREAPRARSEAVPRLNLPARNLETAPQARVLSSTQGATPSSARSVVRSRVPTSSSFMNPRPRAATAKPAVPASANAVAAATLRVRAQVQAQAQQLIQQQLGQRQQRPVTTPSRTASKDVGRPRIVASTLGRTMTPH